MVPKISVYTRWNCLATTDTIKLRSTLILTSAVHFNGFSASCQLEAAALIRNMITKPQRRQPDQIQLKLLQMSGDVHPNPGPATKYPCPVCTRNVTSRGVSYKCNRYSGWLHTKCSRLSTFNILQLNANGIENKLTEL